MGDLSGAGGHQPPAFLRTRRYPNAPQSRSDMSLLRVLYAVIDSKESGCGCAAPKGRTPAVGDRPREQDRRARNTCPLGASRMVLPPTSPDSQSRPGLAAVDTRFLGLNQARLLIQKACTEPRTVETSGHKVGAPPLPSAHVSCLQPPSERPVRLDDPEVGSSPLQRHSGALWARSRGLRDSRCCLRRRPG